MWNLDPRAVVPPSKFLETRDVISPTCYDARSSPFPLGVGIYTFTSLSTKRTRAELYFVSPQVATDRAPAYGVSPGWYVIAEPGASFELRVTRVNKKMSTPNERYSTQFLVDGQYTNESFTIGEGERFEHTSVGFVEKDKANTRGEISQRVRPFCFEKSVVTEKSASANSQVGTITLEVYKGEFKSLDSRDLTRRIFPLNTTKTVDEFMAVKEGKALHAEISSQVIRRRTKMSPVVILEPVKVELGTITIHVREKSWMRMRRLIDDMGEPCTLGSYKDLLQKDISKMVYPSDNESDGDTQPPPHKRIRIESEPQ